MSWQPTNAPTGGDAPVNILLAGPIDRTTDKIPLEHALPRRGRVSITTTGAIAVYVVEGADFRYIAGN